MTIVVLWYREKLGELWCAADTRISRGAATATDSGPKILPVPVVCRKQIGEENWMAFHHQSFGFAYAGSTLSAISTHALATACTQNLVATTGSEKPITLEAVANVFRSVGQHYISDMSSRMGSAEKMQACFFEGMIFGFCFAAKKFKAYAIVPSLATGTFEMLIAELDTSQNRFHPMGSGTQSFLQLNAELAQSHPNPGVMTTMQEMLAREVTPDVGGHLQIGVSTRTGFDVLPILNSGSGPGTRFVSFLGWDVTAAGMDGKLEGYRIGYRAFGNFG